MKKLLEIKDLAVSFRTYGGSVNAVRGITFDVYEGECIAIVGESGCGKSVTAKTILRLIPTPPGSIDGGSIMHEGKDILKMSMKEVRDLRGSKISMIFQDPMTSLNPTMKIGKQIIESIRKHNNISKTQAAARALETLTMVEIPSPQKRMNQYPHEFSGGMRQRAMIAMAIACDPKLLIADEPTTALDVTIQAQILDILKDLKQKTKTSVMLITHDLGIVANMADRVLVFYAGKVIESGTPDHIFENTAHPYTVGLLNSVPRLDIESKGELRSIEGFPPDLFDPPAGCAFAARCDKAMKICRMKQPEMIQIDEGHFAACWNNCKPE